MLLIGNSKSHPVYYPNLKLQKATLFCSATTPKFARATVCFKEFVEEWLVIDVYKFGNILC